MLFKLIYDETLAQAAYLIGCQRTGEAIIIDPERDIDRYIEIAQKEKLRITAVAETHIHADFLSGSREFAESGDVMLYLSGEGGSDWQYRWAAPYRHRLLEDGDEFKVGNILFRAVHTPGHTPEHLSFTVTDEGAGASEPLGLLTGDFVFVGDLGRPDLLETAVGQSGSAVPAARRLRESAQKFLNLPEFLQVWPAHGAGSACGKVSGAVMQSTVGYERRQNSALKLAENEEDFVQYILSDQPSPPLYFSRMKKLNRDGVPLLRGHGELRKLTNPEGADLAGSGAAVIDIRPWAQFNLGHLPSALFLPLDSYFSSLAGSYIEPGREIVIITPAAKADAVRRSLIRIGLDNVAGYLDTYELGAIQDSLVRTAEVGGAQAAEAVKSGEATIVDVRSESEFRSGHIPGAIHIPLPHVPAFLDKLPKSKRLILQCGSGGRSARAATYLSGRGFECANLKGGIKAWSGPLEQEK